MLDLDNPMTQHRFSAAALDDMILERAKLMTMASTEERHILLQDCQIRLERMRQLNAKHFKASPFVSAAIDELETAIQTLAGFDVCASSAAQAEAMGICPVCGTELTRIKTYLSIFCSPCLETISSARRKLESGEGFGTWAI